MRAGQPSQRGRQNTRCCCSRPARRTPISGSTCRSAMASCSRTRPSTGCTRPNPSRDWTGARVFQPRGKVLGGSSSINGLLYVRGQHEDYDRWRQHGNSGWGFDDVLPYFKKAEDQQRGADDFHGAGGPLPVSDLAARRSALRGLHRGCRGDRHPLQSRFQRRGAGRRRILPDHDAAGKTRQHRGGVSSSRQRPQQSACRDFGAGAAHRVRGTSR